MRIGLGQFNATVGDIDGNIDKMRKLWDKAVDAEVDLLVFPEMAVCGYPPEDLVFKKHFMEHNRLAVEKFAADCVRKVIIVGFAESHQGQNYNSAAVLQAGRITNIYRKSMLPNYGVFDERRYFEPGNTPVVIDIAGFRIALTICFDIWNLDWLVDFLKNVGPIDLVLNISASPFYIGKIDKRKQIVGDCAKQFRGAAAYCNLVGGQDELVFDGRSMIADSTGKVVTMAEAFEEDLLLADITHIEDAAVAVKPVSRAAVQPVDSIDETYRALVVGTKDYTHKNGFKKVLLGLSGGIDSAVTAAIAAAALGRQNVIGITMPTRFNSPETIADAKSLADNLGIEFHAIPIESILTQFDQVLKVVNDWNSRGLAYENLQARIRGCILMSLSNQLGALVLTTGNKSETAVGYATLYGDTAGGFGVIKDVPKTTIYKLAQHINKIAKREIIPASVITRPPTAELRPDQKDTDSLPEYDLLDEILKGYVEEDKSVRELVNAGLPEDVVRKVIRMVDQNEYKRRLSPPGVKITPKAFGKDRRLPITNRYRSEDYI